MSEDIQPWVDDAQHRIDAAENDGRVRHADAEYLRAIVHRYERPTSAPHSAALLEHWAEELARAGVSMPAADATRAATGRPLSSP